MIKLSVLLITYNHEKFIEEAIESVLMQKTNFKFELIIGEDYSMDMTGEIVKKYQEKYPEIVKLSLQEENRGASNNIRGAIKLCQGEYIALLEGDDYWTDEYKLQKQVDFLEENPDCSLCGHSYKRYHEEEKKDLGNIAGMTEKFTLEEFLKEDIQGADKLHIRTLTRVFRKDALVNNKVDLESLRLSDYVIQVILLMNGYGACLKDNMGVYRINKNSTVQRNMANFSEMIVRMRNEALGIVQPQYKAYLIESIENKKLKKGFYEFINKFRSDSSKDKVINYFIENNLNKIIIYGEGDLGKLLKESLKNSYVEVVSYIEKKNQPDKEDILVLELLKTNIEVNAIVIVPFYDFDNIKNQLLKLVEGIDIISLEETLK